MKSKVGLGIVKRVAHKDKRGEYDMMTILERAKENAEAVGIGLSKGETVYYDPLYGYNFEELSQLCDPKLLLRYMREEKKRVKEGLGEELLFKPISLKKKGSPVLIPIGKVVQSGEEFLVCSEIGVDHKRVLIPGFKNLKILGEDNVVVSEAMLRAIKEFKEAMEFSKSFLGVIKGYRLDKCDNSTNWEMGLSYLDFTEVVLDSLELKWGYEYYRVVFGQDKEARVLHSYLLKEALDLGLLDGKP